MRKIIFLILTFVVIITLSIIYLEGRAHQDIALRKEIHSMFEEGIKQIDLATMTDFEWDKVQVFGPYTTNDIIEQSMNIRFKGDNGGIEVLEDIFLLVFANDEKAVKTVVLSRKYGDFTIEDRKFLIVENAKNDDLFRYKKG